MKLMPRFITSAFALTVAASLVVGCGMPGQKQAETPAPQQGHQTAQSTGPANGGTFRMYFSIPDSMDPARWTFGGHIDRMGIFETLYRYDKDMNPIPGAAESATPSADGKTWTIKLRKGLKWSDGSPLTAKDWEYSIKRTLNPKTWEGGASAYAIDVGVKGATDFKSGKSTDPNSVGVKAQDDTTLIIEMERPNPDFLFRLCELWTVPVQQANVEKFGKEFAKAGNLVSNGPFVLKSYTVNAEMVLERNPNYSGAYPAHLDSVKLLFTKDAGSANTMLAYQNNEIDFMAVTAADIDRIKADPQMGKQLSVVETGVYKALPLLASENDLLLKNQKLRQAFAMAIDKQKLAETVSKGTVTPTDTLIPALIGDWGKDLGYHYDPAKAKQLLAEAGYPDGKGLPQLTMTISHGNAIDPFILGVVDQWKTNLGVEVKIDNIEYGLFSQKIYSLVNPADYVGWYDNAWVAPYRSPEIYATGGFVNPVNMLPGLALRKYREIGADKTKTPDQKLAEQQAILDANLPPEAKQWDKLLKDAANATDRDQQIALRKQAAKLREDLALAIPLYTWKKFNLVKPQFKGVQFNPFLNGWPTYFDTIYVQK